MGVPAVLAPRQVIQKDMLLWRWARRDIRALQHVLDMLLPDSEADRKALDRLETMSDDELRRLIRDDQKRLRMLYKRGGVAAKEMYCDINCGSMKISQGLHRVLSKLASIDLAEGQRLNRLNDALECIREPARSCPCQIGTRGQRLPRRQGRRCSGFAFCQIWKKNSTVFLLSAAVVRIASDWESRRVISVTCAKMCYHLAQTLADRKSVVQGGILLHRR